MKKDLSELSDEELELKAKRFNEYTNSIWQKQQAISDEISRRKLLKALKLINKIPWKAHISVSTLTGHPRINFWLYSNEKYAPEEFLDLFDGYHDSVYVEEFLDLDARLSYNDGDLSITGEVESLIKFIQRYKLNVDSLDKDLTAERNKIAQQLTLIDNVISTITGHESAGNID